MYQKYLPQKKLPTKALSWNRFLKSCRPKGFLEFLLDFSEQPFTEQQWTAAYGHWVMLWIITFSKSIVNHMCYLNTGQKLCQSTVLLKRSER